MWHRCSDVIHIIWSQKNLSQAQLHSFISYSSLSFPAKWHRGCELWSVHNTLSLLLLHPCTLSLLQFEVLPTGYSPLWAASTWVFPLGCYSSRTAPTRVLSTANSLSGMDCSSIGPPRPTVPDRKSTPAWALYGLLLFFRACLSLVSWHLPWTAVWISALLCSFTECRETTSVSMVFSTGGQRISSDACSPCFPSFLTVLVSVGLFPSHFHHSSVSQLPCRFFVSFLKRLITEIQPAPLLGSTLTNGGFVLKPVKTFSVWHRDSHFSSLTEATLADPSLPTFCHVNTVQ